jgi:hypothetical protein
MTPSTRKLLARIAAVEAAEAGRQSRIRAGFEQRFGQRRGLVLVGEEGAWWRAAEAADPSDKPAADTVGGASVAAYLVADAIDRDALRGAYAAARFCRWRLGWVVSSEFESRERSAGTRLEWELAAVTLRTDGFDIRDVIVTLDRVCLETLRRAEDPFPALGIAMERARDAHGSDTPASRVLATYLSPARQDALRRSTG